MEVDIVDSGDDEILKSRFSSICDRLSVSWILTKAKVAPQMPTPWLAENAIRENMLECVIILRGLVSIRHNCQGRETREI